MAATGGEGSDGGDGSDGSGDGVATASTAATTVAPGAATGLAKVTGVIVTARVYASGRRDAGGCEAPPLLACAAEILRVFRV